ncbi:MAG: intein-containing RctB family protein [Bacillota bacterium]|nr:intein-containing RctB family protein [Bacillota bacterium]
MSKRWEGPLERIDPYRWRIPTSYRGFMRVPGIIYASQDMLGEIKEDQAPEQVANVAALPGIVGASLAMPDIHWGYGFPIGGVAATSLQGGVISPGGIGFDINCLAGEARVLHEFGYHRPIADFDGHWTRERIRCVNPHTEVRDTPIAAYLKQYPHAATVYRVTTESGREIVATTDHPFPTPRGMVPLAELAVGDAVSVYPFEGVPYEGPTDEVLVSEADLRAAYPGPATGLRQVVRVLRERGLLPLRMGNPRLPYLVKLLGFIQGDGTLHFLRSGGALTAIYGEPEDLERIREDVRRLGFVPSRTYGRHRSHRIETRYGTVSFERTESRVQCGSSALALLLRCLGATDGDKVTRGVSVPGWLHRAPLWMKRLFLASLFGAELTAPQAITGHPYNLDAPILCVSVVRDHLAKGRRYLADLRRLLEEFGVSSSILKEVDEYVRKDGQVSVRLRLQISGRPEKLIALWTRVGFEYNRRKQYLANVAAHYLRLKLLVLEHRRDSIARALELRRSGASLDDIVSSIGSAYLGRRFVERSLWEGRKGPVRIGTGFVAFPSFLRERTEGLGTSGQVWDRIIRKEPIPWYGPVYDFTVTDTHHNFIADGFVVSNCGVRILRTNLREEDVRPRLKELVDQLFRDIPAGLGSEGRLTVKGADLDGVLMRGAAWAVEKGYGRPEDLDFIEERGSLAGADPGRVSARAKQRGAPQLGTLGSGNHFLEISVVDEVLNEQAARAFGLHQGQVVLQVHTGSRGLGHQVCTDYLAVMDQALSKYDLKVPDRQLACAPLDSREGRDYFAAMAAAANFAWANRQILAHWARESVARFFRRRPEDLDLSLLYDQAHNIAKFEDHEVEGRRTRLCVHRKGASRAFAAGHPALPPAYRAVGQPVLVPGDMGRASYVLVGLPGAMAETFGSASHGAGRVMSRAQAKKGTRGSELKKQLLEQGIVVRGASDAGLAEEAPEAYKDVSRVVEVMHQAGLAGKVGRMRPMGVIKG